MLASDPFRIKGRGLGRKEAIASTHRYSSIRLPAPVGEGFNWPPPQQQLQLLLRRLPELDSKAHSDRAEIPQPAHWRCTRGTVRAVGERIGCQEL